MKKLLLFIFLLITSSVDAATYYWAATTGVAENACNAIDSTGTGVDPGVYGTIAKAISCMSTNGGDFVIIKDGTYTETNAFNSFISGTSSAVNTVQALNAGQVIYNVPAANSFGRGMTISNRSFLKIDGIVLDMSLTTHSSGLAMKLATGANNITITNFTARNMPASPVNSLIQDEATVHHIIYSNCYVHNSGASHGFYIHGTDNIIERCLIADNGGIGIQFFDSTGVSARNVLRYSVVKNNGHVSTSNKQGIWVGSAGNHLLHNNVFVGNNLRGIQVASSNNRIFHNVSYGNAVGLYVSTNSNTITNNIFIGNTSTQVTDSGTNTLSTNLTTGTASAIFQNLTTNFCLKSGASTAIDLGTVVTGYAYNGSAPDIGACETIPVGAGTVTGNTMDITFPMNLQVPLLPATGMTGFTVNNGRTVTSAVRLSDSQVRLTFDGAVCAAESWTYSYSGAGNVTSTANIGDPNTTVMNQPLFAITAQAVTNLCSAPTTATFTQVAYKWYSLRKDPASALILLPSSTASANTAISVPNGASIVFDVQVNCDNVADCASLGFQLQYDVNSDASWTAVPNTCTADETCFYGTGDADSSIPSGVPTCPISGALTCVDGGTQRDAGTIPVIDMAQNNSTVLRYVVTIAVASGSTIRFRLRNQDGTALNTYTQYPTVTTIANYAGGL